MKKFLKIYGTFLLVSWAANGISEHVKNSAEYFRLKHSKKQGEFDESRFEKGFVWKFTIRNFKDAINSIREYIKEVEEEP